MEGFLTDMIRGAAANPVLVVLAIMAATLILEDVATAGSALLAAEGVIPIPLAILALFLGISLGDLWLYSIGWLAHRWTWLRERIGEARLEKGKAWLGQRLIPAILIARFTPGLRLPCYVASGYLGVSLRAFAAIAIGAVAVWSLAAFSVIYTYGRVAQAWLGQASWIAAVVLLALMVAWPFILHRKIKDD